MIRMVVNRARRGFQRLTSLILRQPDYGSEKWHWNTWLRDNWTAVSARESRAKVFPGQLRSCIEELAWSKGARVRIIEIGSGPISFLGAAVDEDLCDVVAVDPLAGFYKNLMKKSGYSYPIIPLKGTAERLSDLYGGESFDIAYSSNALDHTKSPKTYLESIYRVVKPGGYIFLEGYSKEGTTQKWWGLHMFDIFPCGEELHCKDKAGNLTVLTKDMKVKCIYLKIEKAKERSHGTSFVRATEDDWYTMIFRKK